MAVTVSSLTFHIPVVKQFVNRLSNCLLYTLRGLSFCLCMRSLYDASLGPSPTVSFQTYTIRQLDLMAKSWNELYSVIDGLVTMSADDDIVTMS